MSIKIYACEVKRVISEDQSKLIFRNIAQILKVHEKLAKLLKDPKCRDAFSMVKEDCWLNTLHIPNMCTTAKLNLKIMKTQIQPLNKLSLVLRKVLGKS